MGYHGVSWVWECLEYWLFLCMPCPEALYTKGKVIKGKLCPHPAQKEKKKKKKIRTKLA